MDDLNKKLYDAAERGETEKVRFLVKHGADVNAPCFRGKTPLHAAAKNNHTETALVLINEARARIDLRDDDNKTPMQYPSLLSHTFWAMFRAVEDRVRFYGE